MITFKMHGNIYSVSKLLCVRINNPFKKIFQILIFSHFPHTSCFHVGRLYIVGDSCEKFKTEVRMNINDSVRVRLTEYARQIQNEDAKGYTEMPLWELMQIFGPHITQSGPQLFKNNKIEIV